ncbi:MAG: tetratricopeptide repeat protein [Planctomycetota bacterium]
MTRGPLLALACALSAAPLTCQEGQELGGLSLKDGRFLVGKPIERSAKGIIVHFLNGDVEVPEHLIRDYFSSSPTFDYRPENDQERARLARGMVPFNGRWMKRTEAAKQVQKIQSRLRQRIESQKAHKLWRNRYKVQSRNFTFEHNLPEELFSDLRELLEAYWSVFMKKWNLRPRSKTRPTVYLYADEQDYYQISGADRGDVGFYNPRTTALHFYWDRNDPRFTMSTLLHETTHLLVDLVTKNFAYPTWLEESMAEYFGASRWRPKAKDKNQRLTTGQVQPGRLVVVKRDIRKGKWLGIRDMMKAKEFTATNYAWGWTFVHFLMSSKYAKKFETFYLDLAHRKRGVRRVEVGGRKNEVPVEEQERLLLRYLRVKSMAVLEKQWHEHIERLEVDSLEAMEEAGQFLRIFGQFDQAKKLFAKAVSMGAKLPQTYASYASLLDGPDEINQALAMIDRAIELDPLEPEHYYSKAKILIRKKELKSDREAKRLFNLAAEIDPENLVYQAFAQNW